MKNTLTTAERLALVTAAKTALNLQQINDIDYYYPEDVLAPLDNITDEHLHAYLTDHGFDTFRKPVMQALFADIPIIIEESERTDASAYTSVDAYLNVLDEKLTTMRPNMKELFVILSSGKRATVLSSYVHPDTGELIYVRQFDGNGHSAQRRAALAYEVNMYAQFPEFIDWEINLLRGTIDK